MENPPHMWKQVTFTLTSKLLQSFRKQGAVPNSDSEELMLSFLMLLVGSQTLPPHQENEKTNVTWEPSVGKNYNTRHTVILQSDFLK